MHFKASISISILITLFILLMNNSCKKVQMLSSGGVLTFSVDTLKFDTVFTAAGSFTNSFVIYNTQSQEIEISNIRLQEGASSYFHLNVDGFQGNNVSNLKIAPHDSLYVFAIVNIDPNNSLSPFLITDSLVATLNGKAFYVPFTAYGRNARYIVDSVIKGNNIWDTILPYVIINSAYIPQGSTLTINPGCHIYMHQNSGLGVFGKLIINGTPTDTVIFQGDRLDRAYFGYEGYPGEWGGLYFDAHSNGSRLSYTRIENCGNSALGLAAGIWVRPDSVNFNNPSATPQLTLDHCIVENSIGWGIFSLQGTIVATNCLVKNTAAEAMAIAQGGYDSIVNCTFGNFGTDALTHADNGTLTILNYISNGDGTWNSGNLDAILINCIAYGSLDSEVVCDSLSGATAALVLDHCLLKIGNSIEHFVKTQGCLLSQAPNFSFDPKFKNTVNGNDLHLSSGSPAINAGDPAFLLTNDLENNARSNANGDIGCYQFH